MRRPKTEVFVTYPAEGDSAYLWSLEFRVQGEASMMAHITNEQFFGLEKAARECAKDPLHKPIGIGPRGGRVGR